MRQSIKKATILSYITLILGNLISLVYTPFMLNSLGSNEYGLFSLVNTFISYIYLLDIGMANAVIRYNSKYIAQNDLDELSSINGIFMIIYGFISIIAICFGILIYKNIDIIFTTGLSNIEIASLKAMFIIAMINVVFSFPLNVFNGIIVANEKFIYNKTIALIRTTINPIIMILVLALGYKALGMIVVSTIFNITLGVVNIRYCFKILKIRFKFNNVNISIFKEIFKYSFFIFLGGIAHNIYWSTDQIILGMFVSSTSISIYTIGALFNSYFMAFSNVIGGMFLPKITKMISEECDKDKLMNVLIKVSRIQFYIAMFIIMGFILVGRDFIKIWAGNGYNTSYYIAILVMIPQIFSIIQSVFVTVLEAMNKHKVKSYIYLGVSLLNLILTLVLVDRYGVIGCATATCVGMLINAYLNNLYYKYKLNLNMQYYWKNIVKIIPSMIICFFIGILIVVKIKIQNYLSIGIFVFIFSIVYISICWIMSFNLYEKSIILTILKKVNIVKYQKIES